MNLTPSLRAVAMFACPPRESACSTASSAAAAQSGVRRFGLEFASAHARAPRSTPPSFVRRAALHADVPVQQVVQVAALLRAGCEAGAHRHAADGSPAHAGDDRRHHHAAAAARQPRLPPRPRPRALRDHAVPHLVGDARVGHPHHHPDHAHQAVRRLLPRHRAHLGDGHLVHLPSDRRGAAAPRRNSRPRNSAEWPHARH